MVTVSSVALVRIADISRGVERIVKEYNVKTRLIITMYTAARERSIVMLTMMSMEDVFDREDQFDRFNRLATDFAVARIELTEMKMDESEASMIDAHLELVKQAVPLQFKVIDFLNSDEKEQATSALLDEAIPMQNRVLEHLQNMLEYQQEKAELSLSLSEQTYRRSTIYIIVLAIVAIIVSIAIAKMVISRTRGAEQALRKSKQLLEQRVTERTYELEQKTEQLKHVRDEAIQANRHKSEFLANMSHELRTPLNAIIGFSEVLKERMFGDLNEKQDEYVRDIYSSGRHLLSLINDILDLSKVEAGRMELNVTEFNLKQALLNSLVLIKERASRHSVIVESEVDEGLGEYLGDERKFKQIMLNLLSNAIKFTPDGGRIKVEAIKADGEIIISVHDNGVGIADHEHKKIFEEFKQAEASSSGNQEGTGLGLSLTKSFVEMHKGRIWVESKPGEGSTFTFTLPT